MSDVYVTNIHEKLCYLFPDAERGAWSVARDPGGEYIERWSLAVVARPTRETLLALESDADFLVWARNQRLAPFLRNLVEHAEEARLRFITPGSGKALTYQEKSMELDRYDAVVAAGSVPVADDFPLVGVSGGSLEDAMEAVRLRRNAWRQAAAQIEKLYAEAKAEIQKTETREEARIVLKSITWPIPN
jgi:hypothetical protein